MTTANPTAKAIRSALVGILAAALVIGAVTTGGSLMATLRGSDLQASQAARSAFAVPPSNSPSVLKAPRVARTASSQPTTSITYRVAELGSVERDSQED
jgi:hypothetical protein